MSRVTCPLAMMTTWKFTLDAYLIRGLLVDFALKTVKNLSMSTPMMDAFNWCLKLTVQVAVRDSKLIMKEFHQVTMYI